MQVHQILILRLPQLIMMNFNGIKQVYHIMECSCTGVDMTHLYKQIYTLCLCCCGMATDPFL